MEVIVTNDRHGFTIYEFLIAIGIITCLIILMVPTISRISSSALRQRCRGNLIVLHRAFELYRQSNKGKYPFSSSGATQSIMLLSKYQSDLETYLHCPAGSSTGSYAYDPGHSDNDMDTIILGDAPSYDELRSLPGPSENHDGYGGYYLRVDGNVDYVFGSSYKRSKRIHNLYLLDNLFEKDMIFQLLDSFLIPLD